ncbi:patatin-like phospholipase family protein [Tumebacillus sp. ITR2]|uniref:Patatin-like phospholipase family protein n=1 Tax=Tumebacillus amylolyticus TaxID=2801339 RepID=A0ABS1JDY9_9BACL|nr:CBASS cGAMP-activated phospholipase [Tumebacillus amylolyticus]MBL0388495.1 patatin-like phospholipase family protein [Tumebacillus amylolyticus]
MRKILAIDGGGIKGVFPASFLASLEEKIGQNIGDYFDLIVGTSTGGIIALGLGLGMSAQELLTFYEQKGPGIFSKETRRGWLSRAKKSKYDPQALQNALIESFGDQLLGECKTRVVVPSQNLIDGKIHIYKTAHHKRFVTDYKEKVVTAAMATTAAPLFFPAHVSETGVPMVDGGLGANNPVGLAVVEAIGVLGWDASDLRVLSLGCTSEPFVVDYKSSGLTTWVNNIAIINTFMTAQSFHSLGTAMLLAGRDNVVRISPTVPKDKFKLDGVEGIQELKALGVSEAREQFPLLSGTFFQSKAEPFEPLYSLQTDETITDLIGLIRR